MFLENLKECWDKKQKEVENRFLELSDSEPVTQEPKPKKQKSEKEGKKRLNKASQIHLQSMQLNFK